MTALRLVLTLGLVVGLVAGCSGQWRFPKWRLPRRGPVDVFLDVIDEVSRLGEGIARQFRGMTGGRR